MTELFFLILAVAIAGLTYFLKLIFRLKALDAIVIAFVFAEFIKKLSYVALGASTKGLSLVLAAPLVLAPFWVTKVLLSGGGGRRLRRVGFPMGLILSWFGMLGFFTILNPEGSLLVLLAYASVVLWVLGASGALYAPGRVVTAVFWLALLVGAYNIAFGPDPLWRAYNTAAAGVSVGAHYTAQLGYTGSLFSSPAEFGAFTLAATALLLASGRPPAFLLLPSLSGALFTGSRYVLFGVLVLWGVYALLRWIKLKPYLLLILVLAYPFLQDQVAGNLLQSGYHDLAAGAGGAFEARLLTVGTLGARVGFSEALGEVISQYGVKGVGLLPFWGDFTAKLPDDRHNLLLWLIIRSGVWGLFLYLGFVLWHYRLFYWAYHRGHLVGRVGVAYLTAALLMSMGGPQATNAWFFLALGVLVALALELTAARMQNLFQTGGTHGDGSQETSYASW